MSAHLYRSGIASFGFAVEQVDRAIPDLVGLRLLRRGDPGGRRRGRNRIGEAEGQDGR